MAPSLWEACKNLPVPSNQAVIGGLLSWDARTRILDTNSVAHQPISTSPVLRLPQRIQACPTPPHAKHTLSPEDYERWHDQMGYSLHRGVHDYVCVPTWGTSCIRGQCLLHFFPLFETHQSLFHILNANMIRVLPNRSSSSYRRILRLRSYV
jgi:hypothetical protein